MIQGSAADQTKQAVIDCHEAGHTPLLQIHDELCFNIKDEVKDVKVIKKTMESCIEFKVPSLVDTAIGNSWGEVK